jgi:hypothetical protein
MEFPRLRPRGRGVRCCEQDHAFRWACDRGI